MSHPLPLPIDVALRAASAALQAGQPLAALQHVGSRSDALALALRGTALAQLSEFDHARALLSQALALFAAGGNIVLAAKAMAALAEVSLATRDFDTALQQLDSGLLRQAGDLASAAYVDVQRARLLAFIGRKAEALALLSAAEDGPAARLAGAELAAFDGRFRDAATMAAGVDAANALLHGEAQRLVAELRRPAFRLLQNGHETTLSLIDIEGLTTPYVDTVRRRFGHVDLRRKAAHLELLAALARGPVTAQSLFGRSNEALEARLRMEVSRLRKDTGLTVEATPAGLVTGPLGLLLPELEGLEALLADSEAWPARAIAATLGESVRTVERKLRDHPRIAAKGQARSRRYHLVDGAPGIATRMLLLTR